MEPNFVSLPHAPRELAKLTGERIPYRKVYQAVLNGEIDAEQVNGRWFVRRDDLPAIARRLGLFALNPDESGSESPAP